MKKVLLISGIGGAGLVAAGTGIGISASSSSPSTEKTRKSDFDDSSTFSSPKENENLSESTKYKPFEEALKEIEKMGENSDISSKIEELEKNLDEVSGELLEGLEIKLRDQINKFKWSEEADKQKLFDFLGKIAEKRSKYEEQNKKNIEV